MENETLKAQLFEAEEELIQKDLYIEDLKSDLIRALETVVTYQQAHIGILEDLLDDESDEYCCCPECIGGLN